MRTLAAALGVALGVCILLLAPPTPERAAALGSYHIGDAVALPALQDPNGEITDLAQQDDPADQTPLVIEFWSARCPIVRGYEKRVEQLALDYADRGVRVIAITACDDESPAEIRARRQRRAVDTPLLIDPAGRLAEQLGVDKTPHFVILNASGELVYSGAFDANLIDTGSAHPSYVRDALDAVLAGQPVAPAITRTFGSPVRRQLQAASAM
jgi:hypothetical protein